MENIKLLTSIVGILMLASVTSAANAAAPVNSCASVKVATGPEKKGYSVQFGDLITVCGKQIACEVNTNGGPDNMTAISSGAADMGIATKSVYDTFSGEATIGRLMALANLGNNFIHLLAGPPRNVVVGKKAYLFDDVKTVQFNSDAQLPGSAVAAVGSGQIIAKNLNDQFAAENKPRMNVINVDATKEKSADAIAVDMLLAGQVDVVLTMMGYSISNPIASLPANTPIRLIPFTTYLQNYKTGIVNYTSIGQFNKRLPYEANILFTQPFRSAAKKAQALALQKCIMDNAATLAETTGYSAAWKSVSDPADVKPFNLYTGK